MGDGQSFVHCQGLCEGARGFQQLPCRGVQHALNALGKRVLRCLFQCDLDCFAAEIGRCGGGTRVAPPRIADQVLASARQANEGLDVPRVASKRGEKPLLCVGADFGAQFTFEYSIAADETFVGVKLWIRADRGTAGRLLDQQHVQRSADLPRYIGLD
jgi:hypothetical protein